MKVAICYTPLASARGKPLLSQNRQFQWYSGLLPYAVYPVVMAAAATLMQKKGHEVFWMDYIAENKSYEEFVKDFVKLKLDLAVFESKTPVIKKHWKIINDLKKAGASRRAPTKTKFVLCGDHVSALPSESYKNSKVDKVLIGGDYDILLDKLVMGRHTGLPLQIDRELTKWKLYAYNNGNYKYTPGAYTMAGRDCWWRPSFAPSELRKGKQFFGCTFCSWTGLYPKWRVRNAEDFLDEIGYLISLGVKEVFDDTGTFPVGDWLKKFCFGMIERGYSKKVVMGCNMRAGVLKQEDFNLMKKAGFRFILFGVESANNKTLEKINKGLTTEQIESALKMAKKAGLSPHATIMFGYPWESLADAQNTIDFAKRLFKEGVIEGLQGTIVIPYPGTKLFEECKKKKLLRTLDWDKYDMRMPIMKSPIPDEKLKELVRECYSTVLTPRNLIRKIWEIRNMGDIKYLGFRALKYLSKLGDFS